MNRFVLLSAATASFALTPAAMAKDDDGEARLQNAAVSTTGEATPVRLIEWDGDFELMKTSRRMRVWRSHLAYRLTVDAEGKVTDCELTESFRLRRVSDRLCDVLSQHHHFEPAYDENGQAVEGTYTARISYQEVRERM